jgi:amino acid permease
MDDRNDINKSIIVLFVLFCAIVLKENATGGVSSTFVLFMGVILISLCLASILFPGKKDTDILKDH